jgi:hypothetical protein
MRKAIRLRAREKLVEAVMSARERNAHNRAKIEERENVPAPSSAGRRATTFPLAGFRQQITSAPVKPAGRSRTTLPVSII